MPAAVATPLLQFGVPAVVGAAGMVAGSKMNSSANKTASKYEYDATMKALEDAKAEREYNRAKDDEQRTYERGELADNKNYTRGQYADYLGRLKPYEAAGAGAVNSFAARLPGAMAATVPTTSGAPGAMISIKAPGGKVFQVPAATRAHWEQKGAQVIG